MASFPDSPLVHEAVKSFYLQKFTEIWFYRSVTKKGSDSFPEELRSRVLDLGQKSDRQKDKKVANLHYTLPRVESKKNNNYE